MEPDDKFRLSRRACRIYPQMERGDRLRRDDAFEPPIPTRRNDIYPSDMYRIASETAPILPSLLRLHDFGILTTGSQPAGRERSVRMACVDESLEDAKPQVGWYELWKCSGYHSCSQPKMFPSRPPASISSPRCCQTILALSRRSTTMNGHGWLTTPGKRGLWKYLASGIS